MQKLIKIASLAVVASLLAACGGHGGAIPSQVGSGFTPQSVVSTDRSNWHPYYTVLPAKGVNFGDLDAQLAANQTIPFFKSTIKSPLDGNTYTYWIAGKNPHTSTTTTNITYVPIVLVLKFPGGVTIDPRNPACGDTVSVEDRFYDGPNFKSVALKSNGINVGTTQINDGDQRAQWWSLVKGTGYHTHLKPSIATPIVITKTAPTGSTAVAGVCSGSAHDVGEIDINAYDSMIQSIDKAHATPNEVPMVLTYNVVETESGSCCIIGYHSDFSNNGTQAYAVGAYTDQLFSAAGIRDIHAWTHEIGELINDPFVSTSEINLVPAWGHIGQQSGCQDNLEVGDPLTGTPFIVKYNGFTYHPQELVFFDWFFRTPSEGTAAKYSFEGTFTTTQGACT